MASVENEGDSFNEDDAEDYTSDDEDYSSHDDSEVETELETDCNPPAGSKGRSLGRKRGEPCRYYNKGSCRDEKNCRYLHICKYALRGNCLRGAICHLKHPRSKGAVSSRSHTAADARLNNGRYYQWQLDDGNGWKDIENDHIIEAQYCLPHTKGINVFNTPFGAVKIDFKKIRVLRKRLQVRRLDDGKSSWQWYCLMRRNFVKYGEKDLKGNPSPAASSDIEKKFQSNPDSSFTFTIASDTFDIIFKEMRQVSTDRKRKVVRRPQFREHQPLVASFQKCSLVANKPAQSPLWQFEGNSGKWHYFCQRTGSQTECSISSDDIEKMYQQNPNGAMDFTVNGESYKLDFKAMKQTKQGSRCTRKIRRVLS